MMSSPPVPSLIIELNIGDMRERLTADPLGGLRAGFVANVLATAELVRGAWVDLASEMQVRETGDYIDGIRVNGRIDLVSNTFVGDAESGTLEVVVDITNTSQHAHVVEVGHGPYAMPDVVDWSKSKHRSKGGTPYISVPFRHGAFVKPADRTKKGFTTASSARMMPEGIYNQAKRLASRDAPRAGAPTRLSHRAAAPTMPLSSYPWDAKRSADVQRAPRLVGYNQQSGVMINPSWKSSKFSGMFKVGAKGHTRYLTIRRMTPYSTGWRIPAVSGKRIVARLARNLQSGALGRAAFELLTREVVL